MGKVDFAICGAEAVCESGGLVNYVRFALVPRAVHPADAASPSRLAAIKWQLPPRRWESHFTVRLQFTISSFSVLVLTRLAATPALAESFKFCRTL